jgi:hypothetical protein
LNNLEDLRNAKSKIKSTLNQQTIFLAEDGSVTGFNLRKLKELVPIITQLSNREKQIEILLKRVYFSYEFILALVLTFNSAFIDWHEHIVENLMKNQTSSDANLLRDISSIYCHKFKQFQTYPDSIITEVLSRLSRNETLVQKFESEFHKYSRRVKKECSIVPVDNYFTCYRCQTARFSLQKPS